MTGIASVRSWVMVLCSVIPRAYLHSHFLAKIRANCESEGKTLGHCEALGSHDSFGPIGYPEALQVRHKIVQTLLSVCRTGVGESRQHACFQTRPQRSRLGRCGVMQGWPGPAKAHPTEKSVYNIDQTM